MMTALEAALAAQSSKYTTVSQQMRMEVKEALAKAHKVGAEARLCSELCCTEQGKDSTSSTYGGGMHAYAQLRGVQVL
jgi:hypothetical protein